MQELTNRPNYRVRQNSVNFRFSAVCQKRAANVGYRRSNTKGVVALEAERLPTERQPAGAKRLESADRRGGPARPALPSARPLTGGTRQRGGG